MGDIPHINFRDYERLDNLEEISIAGFQLVNPMTIHIKNSFLTSMMDNKFSSKQSENYNVHLTHFLEARGTTNPPSVSESDKRLRLFGYDCYLGRIEYEVSQTLLSEHKYLDSKQEIENFG